MFYKDLNLPDLVNLEDWQNIQDLFAEALEITLRTISPDGAMLSNPSRPNRLCGEILSNAPSSNGYCKNCLASKSSKLPTLNLDRETNFKCPVGLDIFVTPIKAVGNRTVAYTLIGPLILKSRKSISEYTEDAKGL